MENSRGCDICSNYVHEASYAKQLRSKKHVEKIRQDALNLPDWLFQEPNENMPRKTYNHKPLKQTARDNIKLVDKQLNKELADKMIFPSYFTVRILKIPFNITLDSHHIKHANSELSITTKFLLFEKINFNRMLKEMANFSARLILQIELYISLKNNQN